MVKFWTAIKAVITLVDDIKDLSFRLDRIEQELEEINRLLLINCDKIRDALKR